MYYQNHKYLLSLPDYENVIKRLLKHIVKRLLNDFNFIIIYYHYSDFILLQTNRRA